MLKISIITPSFNQGKYLEETIRSVLLQGYPTLEYFVIDGGSTDDSLDIIKKYDSRLTGWMSEPDKGHADAVIKGMKLVSGDIINWLNSDDILMPGALYNIAESFKESDADLVVGHDLHLEKDLLTPVFHFKPSGYRYPDCLRFWSQEFRYHQPCTFFKRDLYDRAQGLNPRFHYAMDYDLYCRMLRLPDVKVAYTDQVVSGFRLHNDSKTSQKKLDFLIEMREISQQHWAEAGFNKSRDKKELDEYTVYCLVYQVADAVRRGLISNLFKIIQTIIKLQPFYAIKITLSLIMKKLIARKR